MYGVRVHAFCVMSNHYHLLLSLNDALQLARFMNFVQSNLAREAGRIAHWRERFWGRRYQAILVSDEPAAQLDRLRYILSQGCKEGLVRSPELWPGANCVRELLSGQTTMQGVWVDRTALYRDRSTLPRSNESSFTIVETLTLTPLPCFNGSSASDQQRWIRSCVDQIAAEARQAQLATRRRGRRSMSDDAPRTRWPLRHSRAPWFHVASPEWALMLGAAYYEFRALHRSAAEKLERGLDAHFPEGSFPPAGPYIPLSARSRPQAAK
jgi:hypothetical protein